MAQQFNIYKGTHNIKEIDDAIDKILNLKTVNGVSLFGPGNVPISTPTSEDVSITTISGLTATTVQEALVQIYAKAKEAGLDDDTIAEAIATYLASHPIEGVAEAPEDGKQYARKDGAWVEVKASSSEDIDAIKSDVETNTSDISDIKDKNASQDTEIQTNTTNIAANAALIKTLQESGLPVGATYAFTFLEESAMDGLTVDNTTANILYFGLEEDNNVTTEYDSATGLLTDSEAEYDSSSGWLTLPSASYDQETGLLTL